MNPRDLHTLAIVLANRGDHAALRSAVSRAYYAVFNVASELLQEMGFHINKGPAGHSDIYYRLLGSGDAEVVDVGSTLGDLRAQRISADYRMQAQPVENQKNAQLWVKRAGAMIQALDVACSKQPDARRAQIITAIRTWEQSTGHR